MAFRFEKCSTCTTPRVCAMPPMECLHNPMATHCNECGSFLVNEGVEGHFCRSEHCEKLREERQWAEYLQEGDAGDENQPNNQKEN